MNASRINRTSFIHDKNIRHVTIDMQFKNIYPESEGKKVIIIYPVTNYCYYRLSECCEGECFMDVFTVTRE